MALEVGLIGTGYGRAVLAPAVAATGRGRVAAVWSRRPEKAKACAAETGARAVSDWQALCDDPGLGAVVIAVPPEHQPAVAEAALAQGKAVFLEKPLAASLAGAQRIAEAQRQAGVPAAVDFLLHETESWARAEDMVRTGETGAVAAVRAVWRASTYANRSRATSWKTAPGAGAGVLANFAVHAFHAADRLFGPVRSLSATLAKHPDDPRDTETRLRARLATDGPAVDIDIDTDAEADGPGHTWTVEGARRGFVLSNDGADHVAGFRLFDGASGELLAREPEPAAGIDGRIGAAARILGRLFEAAETGAAVRPDAADGLRAQALLDAAVRSNAQGGAEVEVWR